MLLLTGLSLIALTGCGSLGLGPTDPDQTIYLLEPKSPTPSTPAAGSAAAFALAVAIPGALESLDTRRIALVKPDGTLDYYASASWPDRLPLLVQSALISAFQASGRVPLVSRIQDAMFADYVLTADIRDCAAHYTAEGAAPQVTVTLNFQAVVARGRKIVAGGTVTQSAPAAADSTAAVVAAYNVALAGAVDQVVAWTLTQSLPVTTPVK